MHISDTILSQLNEQADLVAIIRRHTTLKPAGREFKGCCPFHGEKTPSFFVNPQSNLYYCFGCGAKGNAISFLVDYERLTFVEAVKTLSEQTGIALPKDDQPQYTYQKTPQQNQSTSSPENQIPSTSNNLPVPTTNTSVPSPQSSPRGDLYQLLRAVTDYYSDKLRQNPVAIDYLQNRGISWAMIELFEIGFAPVGWQHLQESFADDLEGLKILGLVRTSQHGRDFNLFRDRIIFPIKDKQGRVLGFAGRTLLDEVTPKYINSSDSVVFQKQHILYGYYESRQARANNWLVVEGYMDVIALYQAGIFGAVAPMGTAVNARQINSLLKFNDTLTLCFDGDEAGQRAALRTLEVAMPILHDGKQLKFLTLPDNHDPDTYIAQKGTQAMQTAIDQALSLSDYLFLILQKQYDLTRPESKAAAMAFAKSLTEKLPKGSSFRWWLNSDLYKRLKQKQSIKTLTNYENLSEKISPSEQLLLCILYQPSLAQLIDRQDEHDLLHQLYQQSKLIASDSTFETKFQRNHLAIPPLPNWTDIYAQAQGLEALVIATKNALPYLSLDGSPSVQLIDAQTHFILMGLPDAALQARIGKCWRDFFYQINRQTITDIHLLFNELLCHLVILCIRHDQNHASHLLISQLQKRRLITLEQWQKHTIKPAIEAQYGELF